MDKGKITAVVGVGGSGKTTYANEIACGRPVIHVDSFWFEPGTNWKRRTASKVIDEATKALDTDKDVIIEGVCDPTVLEILQNHRERVDTIYYTSLTKRAMVAALITRSCRRYAGVEPQNSSGCVETHESRADMVLEQIEHYYSNIDVLARIRIEFKTEPIERW